MPLRNLPTSAAQALDELISIKPGQVSSMALTRDAGFDMTLLAFGPGESVSEEEYFGDVLYYVVDGTASVVLPTGRVQVAAGEVLKVDAHVLHAVEGAGDAGFKLLQINLRK